MSDRLKTRLEFLRELTRMTETDKPDEFPPEDLPYDELFQRYVDANEALLECRQALAVPEGESLLDHIRLHLEEHAKCSTGLDKLAEEVRAARLALQSKGLNELAAEGQWIELTGKQDAEIGELRRKVQVLEARLAISALRDKDV